MLKCRIIPCLDVANGRVVKGINFVGLRDAGDPVEAAERYDKEEQMNYVFLILMQRIRTVKQLTLWFKKQLKNVLFR